MKLDFLFKPNEEQSLKISSFLCIATLLLMGICILCLSIPVHAEELPEEIPEESQADSHQNERLNYLELHLEEMGYCINEIELSIEAIQESQALEAEQRLSIVQQLELLIIGINDLCNFNIELLGKLDTKELTDTAYQNLVVTALETNELAMANLNQTMLLQSETTVSGNMLVSNLDTTLKEGQTADTESNKILLILLLIGLGTVLGAASAIVLTKGFNRHV